jgi:hypothetical protein
MSAATPPYVSRRGRSPQRRLAWLARGAAALLAASAAAGEAPPTWEIGPGSKAPSPIMATPVRGRLPAFNDPEVTYVVAFVNFAHSKSRQVVPALDRIQTEHGKKVAVVAITEQGADDARAFVEGGEWAPQVGFAVAADPVRNAFRSFFGPRSAPDLPQAFIMRGGIVLWSGNPAEFAAPVAAIVGGTWDLAAAKRAAEQRALWEKVLADVEALAREKRYDEALASLKDACESAVGDQRGQCLGVRFGLLVRAGRVEEALAVGDRILAAPLNAKQPAGLAWLLVSQAPQDARAREFALRAARMSDEQLRGKDAMVAAILARAQFAGGQRTQAVETARRALTLAETPDLRTAIRDDLRRYEVAAGGGGPPPAPR